MVKLFNGLINHIKQVLTSIINRLSHNNELTITLCFFHTKNEHLLK